AITTTLPAIPASAPPDVLAACGVRLQDTVACRAALAAAHLDALLRLLPGVAPSGVPTLPSTVRTTLPSTVTTTVPPVTPPPVVPSTGSASVGSLLPSGTPSLP
ncbi:MAG TPA: hypothetical protein VHE83_02945, partial [Mycobacteriales bacterium]|nr:hypothetical protein [Mycobacteriales bacterium]